MIQNEYLFTNDKYTEIIFFVKDFRGYTYPYGKEFSLSLNILEDVFTKPSYNIFPSATTAKTAPFLIDIETFIKLYKRIYI